MNGTSTITAPLETGLISATSRIRANGVAAFRDNKLKLFTGHPLELKWRVHTSLVIRSNPTLESVLSEAQTAASECGLIFHRAGREYPLHLTLLEADCPEDRWSFMGSLWPELHTLLRQELAQFPTRIDFTDLVVDNCASLLMMAPVESHELFNLRSCIGVIYADHGLQARPMTGMCHSTIARVQAGPRTHDRSAQDYFKVLSTGALKQPLSLSVTGHFAGSAFDRLISRT